MQQRGTAERRILVVDDNEDAANSLVMLLQLMGHEVQSAYDGFAALEQVERFGPDVVLLDIGLPEIDGYEVAKRIRARPSAAEVRIIALTGWSRETDRQHALESGFDDHVAKPVEIDRLRAMLSSNDRH